MRAGERGYALMLALVVVATLAFVVLASARVLNDVTVSTVRLQESRNEVVAAESLLSRAAFLLITEEISPRALIIDDARFNGSSFNLDGSWYQVQGVRDASIAVQDEAGLFNLNSSDQQGLAALLAHDGQAVSAELAAALMDYTDGDDLTRDGGAEGRAYQRAGLPPPADRPLSSRWQALEVIGWREARIERSAIWSFIVAGPSDMALNVNTAPALVLQAVLGDRRRAEALVAQRAVSPFRDVAEVEALTGGVARADGVTFAVAPARGFRVQAVFGSRRARHGIERRLELGDAEAERPFEWVEEREVRLAPLRDGEAINSLSLDAPAS